MRTLVDKVVDTWTTLSLHNPEEARCQHKHAVVPIISKEITYILSYFQRSKSRETEEASLILNSTMFSDNSPKM